MTDSTRHSDLENDASAIAEFTDSQVARTEAEFCDLTFEIDTKRIAGTMEDPRNLGSVLRRGKWIYNWHRSSEHPRGRWRRIPDGNPVSHDAHWRLVFDLDAFCKSDGEDWHWRGADALWSDPERVLISLSRRGSDQIRHLEWDCITGAAVPNGFDLAPARSSASWLDADTLLLATRDKVNGATKSGWPRVVVKLRRGAAIEKSDIVYEIDHDDLEVRSYSFPLRDGSRGIAYVRMRNIGDSVKTLQFDQHSVVLDSPMRTSCSHNDKYYAYVAADDGPDPAGSLILRTIDGAQKRVLFTPRERRAVHGERAYFTKDFVYWVEVDTLTPIVFRLDLRSREKDPERLPLPCDAQSVRLLPFDAVSDGTGPLLVVTSGFLSPNQTWIFDQYDEPLNFQLLINALPSFDNTGMEVRMHMAVSDDGTEIPYHIVLPKDHKSRTGDLPVLQYGYGGFGRGLSPFYLGQLGSGWLERGGAYVVTYIRGGNEFGNSWHLAAKADKRFKSYEDFAAIASDLVKRGYSRPEKIACHGASNGGLLCGVMLTRYPERFGAVWADVGVFDQVRFHLFPAGAGWIDEYGDPEDLEAREWLLRYSPVHNVAENGRVTYPPALIVTNDTDDRVDPSHSRRFVAILQDANQPAWYYSGSGGHSGGGKTKESAEKFALGLSFLRRSLKI